MNTSRGVKRKRGLARSPQEKAQLTPEQILPGKLVRRCFILQEGKAKVNETQIIVKKLRSSTDKPGTATHNPANTVQDLESQPTALKALNLAHFAAATLIQKLKHNRTLSTNETVLEFISTPRGKIRNRLTSCKSFSGRASDLVTDLQAIPDLSVAKSSISLWSVRRKKIPWAKPGKVPKRAIFSIQTQSSDHHVDDGWESGSVHSQNDNPSTGQFTTSTDSDSELGSTPDADPPALSNSGAKSKVKLKPEMAFESDDGGSTPDSDSDSDTPLPSSRAQKASKPSGGAGTSTFLPSLSVGYIPGTGDSDPEDELEVLEGKSERKNRRGQRARRAIWEKKYGKGVKHAVKQREEEAEKQKIKEERRCQREAAAKRPHLRSKGIRGTEVELPQRPVEVGGRTGSLR